MHSFANIWKWIFEQKYVSITFYDTNIWNVMLMLYSTSLDCFDGLQVLSTFWSIKFMNIDEHYIFLGVNVCGCLIQTTFSNQNWSWVSTRIRYMIHEFMDVNTSFSNQHFNWCVWESSRWYLRRSLFMSLSSICLIHLDFSEYIESVCS